MKQDAFSEVLFDIVIPDLGVGSEPLRFVTWLVPVGAKIIPGERLAELLTQGIVLLLEATQEGELRELCMQPGMELKTGDVIGRMQIVDSRA